MRSLHARRAPGMAGGGGSGYYGGGGAHSRGSLGAHGVRTAPWSGREVGEAVEPHLQVLARLASEEELLAADGRVDGELEVEFALESDGGDRGEGDPPLAVLGVGVRLRVRARAIGLRIGLGLMLALGLGLRRGSV